MQRCKERCVLLYEPPSTRTVRLGGVRGAPVGLIAHRPPTRLYVVFLPAEI